METQKKDLLTNELFVPHRTNQKFINPANRIKFNNGKAKTLRKSKEKYDKPLSKNYTILKEVLGNEKNVIVHREFLLGKGFDFDIFTSHKEEGEKTNPCYYDFMISLAKNDDENYLKIQKI